MMFKPYRKLATAALVITMGASVVLAGCSAGTKSGSEQPASSGTSTNTTAPKKEKVDGGEITTAYLSEISCR
ncbi:MAG: hypothetical protein K0R28_564 [Paenibacillus sp.]|nr:hypothetical protein [Paenibacillus sp.]